MKSKYRSVSGTRARGGRGRARGLRTRSAGRRSDSTARDVAGTRGGRSRNRMECSVGLQTEPRRLNAESVSSILAGDQRPLSAPLEVPLTPRKRRRLVPPKASVPPQETHPEETKNTPPVPELLATLCLQPSKLSACTSVFTNNGDRSESAVLPSVSWCPLAPQPLTPDVVEHLDQLLPNGSDDDEDVGDEIEDDDDDDDEGFEAEGNFRRAVTLPAMLRLDGEDLMVADEVRLTIPPPETNVGTEVSTQCNRTGVLTASVACQTDPVIKPTTAFDMEWKAFTPCDELNAPEVRREAFNQRAGPRAAYDSPYDAFAAVWDRRLIELVVEQTNAFASKLNATLRRPNSRIARWRDTTVDEVYVYLAIVLTMGMIVKARIDDYWSKAKNIFSTPGIAEYMSVNRFKLLNRCIHFNDDSSQPSNLPSARARVFKVEPLLKYLNNKFSTLYDLSRNLSIDESLTQWHGWLSFKQFIKRKAAGVGIKTYELCESETGYLWRFEVHAQNLPTDDRVEAELSGGVATLVLRLLQGLEYRGHTVWMDNFYNSPALARILKAKGFDCAGTLRTNVRLVPAELADLGQHLMLQDDIYGCTSGDVDILLWRDKRHVGLISTYHGNNFVRVGDRTIPSLVHDYNLRMGGVDKKDQMLAAYHVERKSLFWYKKFFKRLLNVSVLNAYILFNHNRDKKVPHRQFRENLILSLLERHGSKTETKEVAQFKQHFPVKNSFLPCGDSRRRRLCRLCTKKRTIYLCSLCNKAFCYTPCFQQHHATLLH